MEAPPVSPRPLERIAPVPPITPANSQIPEGLKKFYSKDIFKTVTFFVLILLVLGVTTTAFFMDKLSSDQMLGVISSLLFLATPSPIQTNKKKIVYQPPT